MKVMRICLPWTSTAIVRLAFDLSIPLIFLLPVARRVFYCLCSAANNADRRLFLSFLNCRFFFFGTSPIDQDVGFLILALGGNKS